MKFWIRLQGMINGASKWQWQIKLHMELHGMQKVTVPRN